MFGSKPLADLSCVIPLPQVRWSDGQPPPARVHKKRRSSKPRSPPAQLFRASWPRPQDVQRLWWEASQSFFTSPHSVRHTCLTGVSVSQDLLHLKTGRWEPLTSTWTSPTPSTSWSTLASLKERETRSKVSGLETQSCSNFNHVPLHVFHSFHCIFYSCIITSNKQMYEMPSSDLQKSLFWPFLPLNCCFSSLIKLCLPYSNLDGTKQQTLRGQNQHLVGCLVTKQGRCQCCTTSAPNGATRARFLLLLREPSKRSQGQAFVKTEEFVDIVEM